MSKNADATAEQVLVNPASGKGGSQAMWRRAVSVLQVDYHHDDDVDDADDDDDDEDDGDDGDELPMRFLLVCLFCVCHLHFQTGGWSCLGGSWH